MGKRLRVAKSICSCASPRYTSASLSSFACRHDDDIWTEIAKYLDGKSLVMLAATCKWFLSVIMHDSVWKYACLRDLQVPDCCQTTFKWINLYASAFGGSHSYAFRQKEKHIDWMRIGAFCFNSSDAFLTEKLICPSKLPKEDTIQNMLNTYGSCLLHNIKTGIWIADLQLIRCPVCDLNTCDGTMQVLDARHMELFLTEEYQKGNWEYKLVGSHDVRKLVDCAAGGIFDIKHLKSSTTADLFNLKSWVGSHGDWQPKAMVTCHAVAINTNLQANEGLHIKYHVMTSGETGDVVSIRISQQLL
ncbi:probable F-box protein At3g61730 [Rutidosis leptorrhynchoides]|uniref:probable F-box protein At3g61730 n=1 Tax=Rutidosis leptorrhynchoides TaxID=125765 RepID=UPI003A99A38C